LKLVHSSLALCRPDSNVAFASQRSVQIKNANDDSSPSLVLARLARARSK